METNLESILEKENLGHLLPLFADQGITDSMLCELSADDLREIGIDKLGERKRLLAAFSTGTGRVADSEQIGEIEDGTLPTLSELAGTKVVQEKTLPTTPQSDFTYEGANGGITITGFRGKGHVVIPDKFDDLPLPVRRIGNEAFKDNGMILSVVIPNGVTEIGEEAFYGCSSMTSVEIPDGVEHYGDMAFGSCSSLAYLEIPKGITNWEFYRRFLAGQIANKLTKLRFSKSVSDIIINENGLFDKNMECLLLCPRDLWRYQIPNGVSSIGNYAFYECLNLTSISIPNSVISIGKGAFRHCHDLTTIDIPNSVTSIGEFAFCDCKSLEKITIPNSVTLISDETFMSCSGLRNITIPNSVTSIGKKAFRWCKMLESIAFPDSVTSIGEGAFRDCSFLQSVSISNSVTSIGDWAFANCDHGYFNTISIPDSVTMIGENAFHGCNAGVTKAIQKWRERKSNPSLLKRLFG